MVISFTNCTQLQGNGVLVAVAGAGVCVTVGVGVGVNVEVDVGELVGVTVDVLVEVGVAVSVEVGVGVSVKVGVAVKVGGGKVSKGEGVEDDIKDSLGDGVICANCVSWATAVCPVCSVNWAMNVCAACVKTKLVFCVGAGCGRIALHPDRIRILATTVLAAMNVWSVVFFIISNLAFAINYRRI
jgi:hypothetical protein